MSYIGISTIDAAFLAKVQHMLALGWNVTLYPGGLYTFWKRGKA